MFDQQSRRRSIILRRVSAPRQPEMGLIRALRLRELPDKLRVIGARLLVAIELIVMAPEGVKQIADPLARGRDAAQLRECSHRRRLAAERKLSQALVIERLDRQFRIARADLRERIDGLFERIRFVIRGSGAQPYVAGSGVREETRYLNVSLRGKRIEFSFVKLVGAPSLLRGVGRG